MQPGDMKVTELLQRAEKCNDEQKMKLYDAAIKECKSHGLSRREATIYCTLSNLSLCTEPHVALKYADSAIDASSSYYKVWVLHAVAWELVTRET